MCFSATASFTISAIIGVATLARSNQRKGC